MPIGLDDYSRFKNTSTIIYNDVETFGKWAMPSILTRTLSESDVQYFVVPNNLEGRPDRIAKQIYGTSSLDWLIIAFSKPRSTLNWPRTGTVLRLPKQAVALAELS